MTDGDERPRPQYGEYATPEEQRARIQRPEVTESLEAGVAPAPEPSADPVHPAAQTRGALADRVVTVGLLVYGLLNVVGGIILLLDFPEFADGYARSLGVDATYTALSAGHVWGAAAAIVLGVGYLVTAWLTWRRLRRGRIAFWVPVAGAIVTAIPAAVCISMAFGADPAYVSGLSQLFLK
ncbi:DUF6264 family protein [Microbacterium sp. T32]|uniref:DUF6264 family protein n=1 Tax=Microbacterium sp. T32 TaxID=1776083 RepID=UPI000B2629DF|nr:DUF6264 family protein [Microbacterium sp. T32]